MEKIKVTEKLLNILRSYIKLFGRVEDRYYKELHRLENMMQKETGIKGIEFFFIDGECAGIGTPAEPDKMNLIHREELE